MQTFSVDEAKTQFAAILALVASGEEVVVADSGKPVALISPYREPKPLRKPGLFRGQIEVPDSFFEPMPEDFLKHFE